MNKSIQVIITSILLIAAFFTAALTFDACTGKKKTVEDSVEDALEQVDGDEFFEDDLTDDGTYESDDSGTTDFSDDSESTAVDYSEADDKTTDEETHEEDNSSYEQSNTYASQTSSTGKYLVIAGNFLVENNANEMVSKLNGMGYSSAEVVNFDYSQYFTVIALRSNDISAAKETSSSLKGQGVDSYVHTRK